MANTVYSNKIIEAKAKDLLTTAVNTRSLMAIDNSLAQEAGMTKTINVYTYAGTAEELGAGEGNSVRGNITYTGNDYTVKMVQQAFDYQDEDYKAARMGEVIYNGQVGTVCGLPVIATNALTDKAYVMSPDAVKLFMKKDVEVEQERDADTRTNSVYLRSAYIVALVDATKICEIHK